MPRVVQVDRSAVDAAAIAQAAGLLRAGGLVAIPTETVYGLAARATDPRAIARIFAAKGRPTTHPLILHVESLAMAREFGRDLSPVFDDLARQLWPGPLTLVVARGPTVPLEITGGGDTVAMRVPAHPVALALIRAVGEPLAAPSANRYQTVSPTRAEHVLRSLGDAVDLILDAGPCERGLESTVVDLTTRPPRVLRPGATSLAALRAIAPDVVAAPPLDAAGPRRSPGMDALHYAPRGRVVCVQNAHDTVAAIEREQAGGARVAAIVIDADTTKLAIAPSLVRRLPRAADAYGAALYAALHDADAAGADVVVIEGVPVGDEWWAVRDRLRRAGGSRA